MALLGIIVAAFCCTSLTVALRHSDAQHIKSGTRVLRPIGSQLDPTQFIEQSRMLLEKGVDVAKQIGDALTAEQRVNEAQQHFASASKLYDEKVEAASRDALGGDDALKAAQADATQAHRSFKEALQLYKVSSNQNSAHDAANRGEALSVAQAEHNLHQAQEHFSEARETFSQKNQTVEEATRNGDVLVSDSAAAQRAAAGAHAVDWAEAAMDESQLTKEGAAQRVEEARNHFSKANEEFEQQMQVLNVAKSRGEEITTGQRDALSRASEMANSAHQNLDRAVATLELEENNFDQQKVQEASTATHEAAEVSTDVDEPLSKVEAEQKLFEAKQRFSEVNRVFQDRMEEQNDAKKRGEEISREERESLKSAHEAATEAQQAVDQATATVQAAAELEDENALLSRDEAEARVQQAQDHFAEVNKDFELKMQQVNEAKARGDDITQGDRDALAQANEDATKAHKKLDKAIATLRTAEQGSTDDARSTEQPSDAQQEVTDSNISFEGDPEERVLQARQHFAEVNEIFLHKMEESEEAKKRGEEVTPPQTAALYNAHEAVTRAQELVDESLEAVQAAAVQRKEKDAQQAQRHLDKIDNILQQKTEEEAEIKAAGGVLKLKQKQALREIRRDARDAQEELDKVLTDLATVRVQFLEFKVAQAQKKYELANSVFERKTREIEESKKKGVSVGTKETDALRFAHDTANLAKETLDSATAALRSAANENNKGTHSEERTRVQKGYEEATLTMEDAQDEVAEQKEKVARAAERSTPEILEKETAKLKDLQEQAAIAQRIQETFRKAARRLQDA